MTKHTMTPERLAILREKVKSNPKSVNEVIDRLKAPDVAELLNEMPLEEASLTIRILPCDEAITIFNEPSFERRSAILLSLDLDAAIPILEGMSSDERIDIIRRISEDDRKKIEARLSEKIQKEVKFLLQFPRTTAGGIMSTEITTLDPTMTVREALDYIRLTNKQRLHVYATYVLDKNNHLLGAVSLRDLIIALPDELISKIMRKYPLSVHCLEDQEQVARKLAKYNLLALPVVDKHDKVLGFVTIDDALDVIVEEQTEDLQKLGGVEALEYSYMKTPLFQLTQKRARWLIVLFLGELLTATAMGYFEKEISKAVVLALFVPLIISSGGNSGSQAATLIIRAIALGETKLSDWWRVMNREILSGLMLGTMLGAIGFLRIAIWSSFSDIYGPHWLFVGLTVAISLVGVVLWGTLSGSMLPFLLKRCGADPATSSAPFVATLVDVTGLVIYFSVALIILRGKLL